MQNNSNHRNRTDSSLTKGIGFTNKKGGLNIESPKGFRKDKGDRWSRTIEEQSTQLDLSPDKPSEVEGLILSIKQLGGMLFNVFIP